MQDFTKRFNGRALDYSKYRPTYPKDELLAILYTEANFDSSKIVADIGSGTGILARMFLENENKVFAVEPNDDMRSMAEATFGSSPFNQKFVSVKGTAEETMLEDESIDLICVGQALHWFDPHSTPKEFKRIIAHGGHLLIIYNDRKMSKGREEFKIMDEYEKMANKHSRDRPKIEKIENGALERFFEGWRYKKFVLNNQQVLDFDGLVGRMSSASYMPKENDGEQYAFMKKDLKNIFDKYQRRGMITLFYETDIFLGGY